MNPQITHVVSNPQGLSFTLSGVDVSIANALRRTMLTQIDRLVLADIHIEENTSAQFHNEIVKHRLQSVPVHLSLPGLKEMTQFCENHIMELDLQNNTEEIMYVTTEHFRVVNSTTGVILSPAETRVLFPAYKLYYYTDLLRLQPGKGETIQGERIKLRAAFQVARAQENSCYTVVSKSTFHNTVDMDKAMQAWNIIEANGEKEGWTAEMTTLKKRDFLALDADRYFRPHSFDFVVRSIGIYDEEDLVARACRLLSNTLQKLQGDVEADTVSIYPSSARSENASSMEHSWDVVLPVVHHLEDRTVLWSDGHSIGPLLDHLIYRHYVEDKKTATFSGFAKFHPHNKECVLRVALRSADGRDLLKTYLVECCKEAVQTLERIEMMFVKNKS